MARRKDSPQKAAMRENDIAPEIMQVDTKTYYFLYQVDFRRMSSFILKNKKEFTFSLLNHIIKA